MKAPAPPRPEGVQDNGQPVRLEKVLCKCSAIVYVHENKDWKALYDKYTPLICTDKGGEDLNERYSISAFVDQRKILQYNMTSSTKVKIKDSFVRCQNEKLIIGARFKSNESAQKYHQELARILNEICPYAKVNKNIQRGNEVTGAIPYKEQKLVARAQNGGESNDAVKQDVSNAPKKDSIPRSIHVRRETDPNISTLRQDSVPIVGSTRRETVPNVVYAKRDSIPNASPKTRGSSTSAENDGKLANMDDPIWTTFLNLANLHSEELSNPRISSIVGTFVLERGGNTFLRQVNDQKLSARLADDLNDLAGQVHANTGPPVAKQVSLTEKPPLPNKGMVTGKPPITNKAPVKPERTAPPLTKLPGSLDGDSSTLDRKATKNKRRAPPPPVRSKSLQNLIEDDTEDAPVGIERATSVSGKKAISPIGKRKAPAAPAPPVTTPNRKTDCDKPLPFFVPPPPPNEPPPEESFSSPVGPLSPDSAGFPSRVVQNEETENSDLSEEQNAVAQLDMVICAEESDMANGIEKDTTSDEPGTPIAKRNPDVPARKNILESVDGTDVTPLNTETEGSETTVVTSAVTPPQQDITMQLQMQQQLLALQQQVSEQQQMLVAAGLLAKRSDDVEQNGKEESSVQPDSNQIEIKTKTEVNECVEQETAVVPPSNTNDIINDTSDVQKLEVDAKVADQPTSEAMEDVSIVVESEKTSLVMETYQPINVDTISTDEMSSVETMSHVIDEDLPPPPPELLEDTIIESPTSSPAKKENAQTVEISVDDEPPSKTEGSSIEDERLKRILGVVDGRNIETVKPVPELKDTSKYEINKKSYVPPPVAPKTKNESNPIVTSSLSDTSKPPVVSPSQCLSRKPIQSSLYAKLKARTAAKTSKTPLSSTKPSITPAVNKTIVQKEGNSFSKFSRQPSKEPVSLASIISEPIPVTRRENLKISDPSTVRKDHSRTTDSVSSVECSVSENEKPKIECIREPVAIGPLPFTRNEKEIKIVEKSDEVCETLSDVNITSDNVPSINIMDHSASSPKAEESLSVDAPSDPEAPLLSRVSEDESVDIESPQPKEPTKYIDDNIHSELDSSKNNSEPVVYIATTAETQPLIIDSCKVNGEVLVAEKSEQIGPNKIEQVEGSDLPPPIDLPSEEAQPQESVVGSPYGKSLTNDESPELCESINVESDNTQLNITPPLLVDATKNDNNPIPKTNGTSGVVFSPLPQTAYTNSNLNEVQSKGYHRITFNNNFEVKKKTEPSIDCSAVDKSKIVVSGTDDVERVNDSTDKKVIDNIDEKVSPDIEKDVSIENVIQTDHVQVLSEPPSITDPVPLESLSTMKDTAESGSISEPTQSTDATNACADEIVSPSVTISSPLLNDKPTTNGDYSTESPPGIPHEKEVLNGTIGSDHSRNVNGICSNGLNGNITNSDHIANSISHSSKSADVNIPPKKTFSKVPPAPKPKPLHKSTSFETAEPPVYESAKDRMIRNIQERGVPDDDLSQVNQSQVVQPINVVKPSHISKSSSLPRFMRSQTVDVDTRNPRFEDVRGTVKDRPPPTVKPKPKPINNNNNNNNNSIINENKQSVFMRCVSEEPGLRKTTNMKTVGSLNIGFARDTARVTRTADASTRGSIPKREPPKTLPKTKLQRSTSSDSTGSNDSNMSIPKLPSSSSIDVDLRSTSMRNENTCS